MSVSTHPAISFCITCKGRAHHLKQTLPHNLILCRQFLSDFEFVVVNYNSDDDLEDWLYGNFSQELSAREIRYVKTTIPQYFFNAHAKNIAHRHATKAITVNLDADNYLSIFYIYALMGLKPDEVLHVPWDDSHYYLEIVGGHGRIALYKEQFMRLGGYDESLTRSWGYEDFDLNKRAEAFGLKMVALHPLVIGAVIPHSNEDRLKYFVNQTKEHPEVRLRSQRRIEAGKLVANEGRNWGAVEFGDFDVHLSDEDVADLWET